MKFLEEHDQSSGGGGPTIVEYYRGKTIFITGGTGFLGKLLIEKLLYSCPHLKQIYVFVRDKKGISPEKRIAALYKNSCFDRLRNERSGLFQSKVTVVPGNMIEHRLGLSANDRASVLENTNVIIHSAATVRFDESLKESLDINVLGALRLMELAKDVHNLESYVHISTAFCNLDYEKEIQEKLYPPAADWREIKDIVDNVDPEALRILTPRLLGKYPNSYVFTKNLAEHAVYEHKGRLPIVIVRPSIVTGCMSEPCPGWIDNFNGPWGLLTAAGQGILRAVYADEDAKSDYVPADIVIKGTLVAAWVRGTKKLEGTDDIAVYNACVGEEQGMSLAEVLSVGKQVASMIALENTLRPCNIVYFKNKLIFKLYVLISHLLPAIAVDLVFRALGNKPKLLKVQRRTLIANKALEYFVIRPWHFINDKFVGLCSTLMPQDRKHFSFSMEGVKSPEQMLNIGLRIRKDLLHQDDKTLPKWRKIYEWGVIIDSIVTYIFYVCVFWWLLNKFLKAYNI